MFKKNKGFTLIELSISLFIMGALAISLVFISDAVSEYNKKKVTEQRLDKIEQAISIFLTANKRLPCPSSLLLKDSDAGFGTEDTAFGTGIFEGGTGSILEYGQVPTKTLELSDEYAFDGWGNKISYIVQNDFASTTEDNFEKTDYATAQIAIKSNGTSGENITTDAIYALISHGENGKGAYNKEGEQIPISGSGDGYTAELTNVIVSDTFDDTFVQDLYHADFDDILRHKTKNQAIHTAGWEGARCLGDSIGSGYTVTPGTLFSEDEIVDGDTCLTDTTSLNPSGNYPQKICGRYGEWSEEMYPCKTGCEVSITNPTSQTKYILDGQQIEEACPDGKIGRIIHTCSGTTPGSTDECIIFTSGCQEFGYLKAVQTFTVPENTDSIKIQVWGAEGGGYNGSVPNCYGGNGGYAEGELTVTSGQYLYFYIGGQGTEFDGGYNGGGDSGLSPRSGGGATDVRTSTGSLTCSTSTDPRVIVAGGGGGGINTDVVSSLGGGGGGTTGLVGDDTQCTGGTQSAGGTTTYPGADAGACGSGGDSDYGAGGSGWYGGGGALFGCGGSGYIGGVTNGTMYSNYKTGNGFARVCWGTSTACDGTHTAYAENSECIPPEDEPTEVSSSGLSLWLDASNLSTITKDGNNLVSQWNDKSGNGKNVTQATEAYKPKYGTSLINGLPAIYCDSTSQTMTNTAGIPIPGDLTIFAVLQDTRNAVNVQILINGGDGETEATNWTYSWRFQSLVPQLFYETGAGANVTVNATTAVPSSDIIAYITRDSNATSSIDFGYLQGAIDFSENAIATNSSGGSDSDFLLFNGFTGKLGELIIYNRLLNSTETDEIKLYLSNKWGITTPSNTCSAITTGDASTGYATWPESQDFDSPITGTCISGYEIENANPIRDCVGGTWQTVNNPCVPSIPTSDLELWLDANDESTITKDVSNIVSQWNDKSGNGYNVTQSTEAYKPKYGTSLINGLPAIYCDSTSQTMTNTTGIPIPGDLTIFAVLQDTRNAVNVQIVINGGAGETEVANWTYSWRFQSLVPQLFYETGVGLDVAVNATTAVPSTDIIAYVTRDSNATSSIDFGYVQGVTDFSENAIATNSSGGSDSDFYLFSGFTGKLGELIIYDRLLTTEETAIVKAYLADKWGI